MDPQGSTKEVDLRANLDLLEEQRGDAAIRHATYKTMMKRHYNIRVMVGAFKVGDLVMQKNEGSR